MSQANPLLRCDFITRTSAISHASFEYFSTSMVVGSNGTKQSFGNCCIFSCFGKLFIKQNYLHSEVNRFSSKSLFIVCSTIRGEIKGCQGKRTDLDVIGDLINQGLTPSEILEQSFSYRRYETMIKRAFFDKRMRETPILRDVKVSLHCGESGSGKTYTY